MQPDLDSSAPTCRSHKLTFPSPSTAWARTCLQQPSLRSVLCRCSHARLKRQNQANSLNPAATLAEMSSSNAHHQRPRAGSQSSSDVSRAQEKRGRSFDNEEEERVERLAKRTRARGSKLQMPKSSYTVGWVCALYLESAAATAMLDDEHLPHAMSPDDTNAYTFGSIGPHNIVIACLPSGQYGTTSAAGLATDMKRTFPSIWIRLMVGIGGGVPEAGDIRLGDVVVSNPTGASPGVVQYDFGKTVRKGRFERTGSLSKPPPVVLSAVSRLRIEHERKPNQITKFLADMREREPLMDEYTRRGADGDRLFVTSYEHFGDSCDDCDPSKLVSRIARQDDKPKIHYGIIASGNQVMKHAKTRERLAKGHHMMCFEMEAAGLMDNFPCLVIRGICDYADSHKAKGWQKYAATTAAAYARELLLVTPGSNSVAQMQSGADMERSSENRKRLLDALKFNQIDKRKDDIKENHAQTCNWLIKHPDYAAWMDQKQYSKHHGFLWIRGKPGAGKSTIMKFALKRARGRTVSFFFNARGGALEKSTLGMYRSLLHQLLVKIPEVWLDADEFPLLNQQEPITWDLETTKDLFCRAVKKLGQRKLTCFVDALDECAEGEVREIVKVFEDLCKYAFQHDLRFYVCFSSRNYPYIKIQHGRQLVLEKQTGHGEDLARYVHDKFEADTGPGLDDVREEILRKASGVFMWVVLVVDILNDEYESGRLWAVKSRLSEIPSKLSELFENILTRDQKNKGDLLLCIQWILYSTRPLKREEYYFALASGLGPDALGKWDPSKVQYDHMDRLILSSSKGLAETTRSGDKTVQFIHESVRDFFLKDNGTRHLWPGMGADFEAKSHERLRDCCHEYSSRVDISDYLSECQFLLDLPKRKATDLKADVERGFPFLEYATNHILHHSNAAAQSVSQSFFFQSFPLKQWIQRSNLFEQHKVRRHNPNSTSLLYIVAGRGLTKLVEEALHLTPDAEIFGGRYGYPLLAALKEGHGEAAKVLLQHIAISVRQDRSASFGTSDSETSTQAPPSIVFADKEGRTPLYFAAERGYVDIAGMLFDLGAQPKPRLKELSPLVRAAEKGQEASLRLILQSRSRPQCSVATNTTLQSTSSVDEDGDVKRAFIKAVQIGNTCTARLLLGTGINVDAGYDFDFTPLVAAAQNAQNASIEFLLDNGADINRTSLLDKMMPIHWAIMNGHAATTRLLIQRGCDLEVQDASGRTPLYTACNAYRTEMVEILLKAGAYVHTQDFYGDTSLSVVASRGAVEHMVLLLQHSILEQQRGNGGIKFSHKNSQEAFGSGLPDFRHMVNKLGETPLFKVFPFKNTHVLSGLLDAGLDPSHLDDTGQTFLHKACKAAYDTSSEYLEGVEKAVAKGLEIDGRDHKGRTPLINAAGVYHQQFVRFLLQHGADPNARDNEGHTPISEVFYPIIMKWTNEDGLATLRSLLEGGADATEPGPNGEKLLDMAHRLGCNEMADILRESMEARGVTS
ncbi:ankyrin repeat-containing domain protein [Colletotrichum phormii]|uniref:Ankyrin repeat-containing domain protein n=1 Tax=Colletotrichum phormii TaxID=359342 RepID=A0AAI9ZXR6_9PEZI|nr:ankyrin repeat-containing domain protein [Colletotrichum phormii]KAK1638898.1 ankyrin repeat-containing domain protein [Colletotrichum phormii]